MVFEAVEAPRLLRHRDGRRAPTVSTVGVSNLSKRFDHFDQSRDVGVTAKKSATSLPSSAVCLSWHLLTATMENLIII